MGAELFFVLSGFPIGWILLDILNRRPGWRDFGVFLTRRAMRTLPLYFLRLAVLLGLFPPADGVAATGPRYATLTQNLIAPMPADNFFAVTWPLAVKEWFYLLFGFAAMFLGRRFGRTRGLAIGLALFLLAPFALRLPARTGGVWRPSAWTKSHTACCWRFCTGPPARCSAIPGCRSPVGWP